MTSMLRESDERPEGMLWRDWAGRESLLEFIRFSFAIM
jgi:hypothetical protein